MDSAQRLLHRLPQVGTGNRPLLGGGRGHRDVDHRGRGSGKRLVLGCALARDADLGQGHLRLNFPHVAGDVRSPALRAGQLLQLAADLALSQEYQPRAAVLRLDRRATPLAL